MKALRLISAFSLVPLLLCAAAGPAQTPGKEFEVATIHPSAPLNSARIAADGRMPRYGPYVDASRAQYYNMSLKALIAHAYHLKPFQVTGPEWLEEERFDIAATLPSGAIKDDAPALLGRLLEERFKLLFHRETAEHKVLALVVGKNGSRLKTSPPDQVVEEDTPLKPEEAMMDSPDGPVRTKRNTDGSVTMNRGSKGIITQRIDPESGIIHVDSSKVTMTGFAEVIGNLLLMAGDDHLVVDQTDLRGNFQISLDISPADLHLIPLHDALKQPSPSSGKSMSPTASDPGGSNTIYSSVEKLGLRLEERKAPVEQLIVDHMEKTPTEN